MSRMEDYPNINFQIIPRAFQLYITLESRLLITIKSKHFNESKSIYLDFTQTIY